MIVHDLFPPRRQAHIYAIGLLTLLTLGTLATLALCLAALWLLVEMAGLLFTSIVECCTTIGATYQGADPLVKVLILAGLAYSGYLMGRRMLRRANP